MTFAKCTRDKELLKKKKEKEHLRNGLSMTGYCM
uniref:Uncharacterized protein n=1 Tax=Rhizophora mucronata TaxID=61149 RepID=A0A2P2PUG8_RHIMU